MICAVSEAQPDVIAPLSPPRLSVVNPSADDTAEPAAPAEHQADEQADSPQSDFPRPQVISNAEEFIWEDEKPIVEKAAVLGKRLAACGDLYRRAYYGGGLILASSEPSILPEPITTGKRLSPIIVDWIRVQVMKDGEPKGTILPTGQLEILLSCETFLQQFRAIDQVVTVPLYLPNFELTQPGYTDAGRGHRILCVGKAPFVKRGTEVIRRFLDVMPFATQADRTNAVAARLTVMLRNFFPGAKPAIAVTANRSHAGKDTTIVFAAGRSRITAISYQSTDWALERAFVGAVKHSPDTGMVNVENARLGNGDKHIASGFLERLLCDPDPTLFSTGSGSPVRRKNDFVVAISTNFGSLSTDLLNRALPIHLELVGNVADRQCPIGNPKLEFLPRHADAIEAESRGMIERWKEAGCPKDTSVRHPFSEWAGVVGGILMVNEFHDFLANYSLRKTADDPLCEGLALLGAARPDQWLRPMDWAELAADLGLAKRLIPRGDQDSDKGRERGMGVVLAAHAKETFHASTDNERLVVCLERARRRFEAGQASTRYRFQVIERELLPDDEGGEGIG